MSPKPSRWQRACWWTVRWLLRRQEAADAAEARQHPDGGPGPYSGPYPWEMDAEAKADADAAAASRQAERDAEQERFDYGATPHPRHMVGIDPAGDGDAVAVVATEQPDGTIVVDNMPADWPEQMRRRFAQPEAECPEPIQQRPMHRVPVGEPEHPSGRLFPGDPGYWEQFG